MSQHLVLADPQTAQDVLTFVGRAGTVGSEGVRLQARGGVLVVTAPALASQGLLDPTPLVLAMRIARADPELECDIVVSELWPSEDPRMLRLPDTGLAPAWAGVTPPRAGWSHAGTLSADRLARQAQWGISVVARGAGRDSGEEAVRVLRASVWGEFDAELAGLPRGVAFAAHAFGFISGGEAAAVTAAGRWSRVTLTRGHVLTRGPVVAGLTSVRSTGLG